VAALVQLTGFVIANTPGPLPSWARSPTAAQVIQQLPTSSPLTLPTIQTVPTSLLQHVQVTQLFQHFTPTALSAPSPASVLQPAPSITTSVPSTPSSAVFSTRTGESLGFRLPETPAPKRGRLESPPVIAASAKGKGPASSSVRPSLFTPLLMLPLMDASSVQAAPRRSRDRP